MLASTPHIGIDCRLAGQRHAGIGRYTANLVKFLLAQPRSKEFSWQLFFHDQDQADEVLLGVQKQSSVSVQYSPVQHYTLREQLLMPAAFGRAHLDLLHVPHFNVPLSYVGPFVVTIHDLLWHEHRGQGVTTLPRWQYWMKYQAYRVVVQRALQQAKVVFVPTNTIRAAVLQQAPGIAQKLKVTPEGIDEVYRDAGVAAVSLQEAAAAWSAVGLPPKTPYVLYVGSLYPHKNVGLIVRALKQLPKLHLVVVGTRSVFQEELRQAVAHEGVKAQVHFAGYIPDEKLVAVLKLSVALIQPSLHEGFGLTGVEALSVGARVLASDIPIFHEVYGKAATFFDPQQVDSLVGVITQVLSETPKAKKQWQQEGQQVIAQYSWSSLAKQTLNTYAQVLRK